MEEYWGYSWWWGEEMQELFFTAVSVLSPAPSVWLRGSGLWHQPKRIQRGALSTLARLRSKLRTEFTSYGKSAKFPLVNLDSVHNLVISCWPPPTPASLPPASSHPSINPVQPWISAQCSRGLTHQGERNSQDPGPAVFPVGMSAPKEGSVQWLRAV